MKNQLNFSMLTGSQLNTFVRSLLALFNLPALADGVIKTLVGKLTDTLSLFAKGFDRDSKDPYTKAVDEKDTLRDKYFNGLKNYVKSFLSSDNDDEVVAANKLIGVMIKHGWSAASLSNSNETSALTSLLSELDNNCNAETTLLNATLHIERIRTAQAEFEETVKARIENGSTELPSITKYRPALIDAVKKLINALESDYEATNDANIGSTIGKIDELILKTTSTVKASKTRSDNQKDSGATDKPVGTANS